MKKTAAKNNSLPSPTKKAMAIVNLYSPEDPNGSYTGTPKISGEIPVQDADDL